MSHMRRQDRTPHGGHSVGSGGRTSEHDRPELPHVELFEVIAVEGTPRPYPTAEGMLSTTPEL
jgi:hypothetical protein